MSAQHTPWPWAVCLGAININRLEIGDERGREVAVLEGMRYRGREDEMFQNARLIAAAPELLEALQCVTEFAAGFCEGFGLSPNAGPISAARAAIAKAKGTAQ